MYRKKEKVYKFVIVVGIATDTDDILGIVEEGMKRSPALDGDPRQSTPSHAINAITEGLHRYATRTRQKFHNFSAINTTGVVDGETVNKPMWWWTSNGLLDRITVPEKEIHIKNIQVLNTGTINQVQYIKETCQRLQKVQVNKENFRVDEILKSWDRLIESEDVDDTELMCKIEVTAHVSSGTYIRQIVRDIREELVIPMHCTSIHRTKFVM